MPDTTKHLLLVEDETALRQAIAEQLADRGYHVEQAGSGEAALEHLSDFAFDVIVTDLRLPGIDGAAVVDAAVERYPDIVAIVVTGYGTVKDAVEAIKRGAFDFVSKPFQIDELLHVLDSALEQRRLKSENAYLRSQLEERYRFEGLIGKSRAMTRLFQLLETVAAASSTILITGETGTGKEIVARAIHQNSPRRLHRFVALNCSAIPETLLEAELFGHVRGAFTGAVGNRQGRLEQAHKGALFLDEVGTMSAGLQMKLLRVLQQREFERVGDSHTTKIDVRVIAATNSDLGKMVADGEFRGDLYYRLNVIPIQLPPLRARKEDIPLLVQHFLDKFQTRVAAEARAAQDLSPAHKPSGVAQDFSPAHKPLGVAQDLSPAHKPSGVAQDFSPAHKPSGVAQDLSPAHKPSGVAQDFSPAHKLTVSQEAMRRLMSYPWPGNVRQLENAIERAVAFSGGRTQIDVADLPPELLAPGPAPVISSLSLPDEGLDLDALIAGIERDLIQRSLDRTSGNKGQAARLLNLKRTTLVEKLKRLQK